MTKAYINLYIYALGASSGIGRATAILFASLGSRIALLARNKDQLEETQKLCLKAYTSTVTNTEKTPFLCLQIDLSDSSKIGHAYKQTIDHFNQLDILVSLLVLFLL